uniref:Uncharacterized protein n=1 Tax=Arundo donax TaxID=35708 RepID=A0A0A9GEP5_ARUDO
MFHPSYHFHIPYIHPRMNQIDMGIVYLLQWR